jgi:hypothetical protein
MGFLSLYFSLGDISMINKNIFFMLAAGISFGVLTAHPLHKVGNHLRRHALKYAGGAVATAGVGAAKYAYVLKKNEIKSVNLSDADLVAVRMRWAGQEDRIGQLKWEAAHLAKTKPCHYVCAGLGEVAIFDAPTKTVTTFFNGERQPVKLSYEQFSQMFASQRIVDLANAELKKQAAASK